ncbi:MAG: GGDEF domain-containing protein [Christensenellales bacterium]|jgi:diguanylate cyclase
MLQIANALFVNTLILIASVTFFNMLLRDHCYAPGLRNSIVMGMLTGAMGCLQIVYIIHVTPDIALGFCWIPIVMMALYMSPLSSVVAAIVIGGFGILLNGATREQLLYALMSLFVAAGSIGASRLRVGCPVRWALAACAVLVAVATGNLVWMKYTPAFRQMLGVYAVCVAAVSALMYLFLSYIERVNQEHERLKKDSARDYLTGLYNFRYFDDAYNRFFHQAHTKKRNLSLLFIDIDNFKKVNDLFGHLNGDCVLRELGVLLSSLARGHDIVTRKGGEEFTMLLIGCGLQEARVVAERVRAAVESHTFQISDRKSVQFTVSIVIATYPETTPVKDDLLEQADMALYRAKRSGRNRVMAAGAE